MPRFQSLRCWLMLAMGGGILGTPLASAHPGHGTVADGTSSLHYATSPLHWAELIAAVLVAALAAWVLRGTWGTSRREIPQSR
ncbi:MAG TPA: hypothetical protein VIY86_07085 [Pirellulaceae bacterium]